jgi:hypothetical protein
MRRTATPRFRRQSLRLGRRSSHAISGWDIYALLRLDDPNVESPPLTATRVVSERVPGHSGVRACLAEAPASATWAYQLPSRRDDDARRSAPTSVGSSIHAPPMARPDLSRRVGKVVSYPPLSEMSDLQRREFHEALLDANTFEDLPGKWQAAILKAEENRPKLRIISD